MTRHSSGIVLLALLTTVWALSRPGTTAAGSLSPEDRAELARYAADTWRSFDRLILPSGLPADRVAREGSGWGAPTNQTSPTNIGAYLWSVLAAEKLGLIDPQSSRARIRRTLETLGRMERTHGFFLNDLDPQDGRSLRLDMGHASTWKPHISLVDNGWLAVALVMVANVHPQLREESQRILRPMDLRFFYAEYDPSNPAAGPGQLRVGYRPEQREYFGHYGMLNSEARIASYLGISLGQLPPEHYYRLYRTLPEDLGPQSQKPEGRPREYAGVRVHEGTYSYRGMRIVPAWGGSMFEALMVNLFVPEEVWGPRSWGVNHPLYVRGQIQHGLEEAGYGFWGFSPAASPRGGYQAYGVKALGTSTEGYHSFELGPPRPGPARPARSDQFVHGVVTPHASFLALRYAPREAMDNLRKLAGRFPIYSDCGFLDSVDVTAGMVSGSVLAVDQGMIMAAIANALTDNAMQRAFSDGLVERAIRPLLAVEEFGNAPTTRAPVPLPWGGSDQPLRDPAWSPDPVSPNEVQHGRR
jgi:hypothetical protein